MAPEQPAILESMGVSPTAVSGVQTYLDRIYQTQTGAIEAAAELAINAIAGDGWCHPFGTGRYAGSGKTK